MCKIITILNNKKSEKNKKLVNEFINIQVNDLKQEEDGYSVLRIKNKKDKADYFVDNYQDKEIKENLYYNNEDIFITHFRTATGGTRGKDGLHLKKLYNRYYFAHNGTSNLQVNHVSDSEVIAKKILKKGLSKKNIENVCENTRMLGKFFIYDVKENELTIFSNHLLYFTALNQNLLAITTYKPKLESVEYKKIDILGVSFETKEKKVKKIIPLGQLQDDDKLYVFRNTNLVKEEKINLDYGYYGGYYGYNYGGGYNNYNNNNNNNNLLEV